MSLAPRGFWTVTLTATLVSFLEGLPKMIVPYLNSPDGRYDMLYLRNYAVLNVKDRLAKIQGIGSVQLFGSGDYSMRIWLNPEKIAARNMTADDVVAAVRKQNVQVAAGVINGPPYGKGGRLQLPINVHQIRSTRNHSRPNFSLYRQAALLHRRQPKPPVKHHRRGRRRNRSRRRRQISAHIAEALVRHLRTICNRSRRN